MADMLGAPNQGGSAMNYLNNIPGTITPYYQPFINQGQSAYNTMNPQISAMTSDPVAFLQNIMKGYQPSNSYQMQNTEMQKAAGNTAAAGGMRGSLNDISNSAHITDTLMGNDMQNWLANVLGIQRTGLGQESHIYDTGYNASNALAGDLSNVMGSQSQLAFQQQQQKEQQKSDLMHSLVGGAGMLGGWLFG